MASKAGKLSLLHAIVKRGFAAIACPRPVGETASVNVKVLENKLVVATADSSLPVARISIVINAGSRNENYEIQGAAHILRQANNLSTVNSTAFAITRNIQQVGGTLYTSGNREIVAYTVETTADHVETGLRYLQDLVQPTFKPWELSALSPTLRNQLAAVSPQERAIELAHRAAFRTGLGNSVYIPEHQIGQIGSEDLQLFVNNTFTPSRTAVVGVGIDNNTITGFARSLDLPGKGAGVSRAANYYGGDARLETAGYSASVAVVGQGGVALNHKELLAFAILEHAIGGPAATKRGNSSGSFRQAVVCGVGDAPVSVRAININYTDAGLFGFLITADARDIGKAIDFLTRALKSGAVTQEDVNRGKALLKLNILESFATDRALLDTVSLQAALGRTAIDANTLIPSIDGITLQQVQDAAKKVASSRLSVGAVGNLANVPYASDLA